MDMCSMHHSFVSRVAFCPECTTQNVIAVEQECLAGLNQIAQLESSLNISAESIRVDSTAVMKLEFDIQTIKARRIQREETRNHEVNSLV